MIAFDIRRASYLDSRFHLPANHLRLFRFAICWTRHRMNWCLQISFGNMVTEPGFEQSSFVFRWKLNASKTIHFVSLFEPWCSSFSTWKVEPWFLGCAWGCIFILVLAGVCRIIYFLQHADWLLLLFFPVLWSRTIIHSEYNILRIKEIIQWKGR